MIVILLGGACRVRVLRSLQHQFSTPKEAEQFFSKQNKENCEDPLASPLEGPITVQSVDLLQPSIQQVSRMKPEEQIQFISEIFTLYCQTLKLSIPKDFLQLVVKGMAQLGRSNILYGLSKGLGTKRSDGSDSVFPCRQVVAGLIEHCVNFFSATNREQVCYLPHFLLN